MNDPPRKAVAAGGSRDVNRQLREMNEALLVSSVRQHELAEKSQQAESLIQCQKDSLEMVVKGEPIKAVLDFLARSMESQGQGRFLVAIHLMEADGFHFGFVAAPSLPAGYAQATRGMDARLELGTCSSAVMSRTPTVVPDFTDPLAQTRWPVFSASVLEMGLSGCFTTPILSSDQRVLGTFAIYYREPRDLNPRDQLLVDLMTSTLALAIERRTTERNLRESEERYRSLVTIITDVPWTTDARGAFVTPQPEWMDYTGQTFEESREFGWADALHPDDKKYILDAWKFARDATAFYQSHGRLWNAATNQYRHFEAGATPLLDPDGRVREWIGTYTDVHERVLEKSQRLFLLGIGEVLRSGEKAEDVLHAVATATGEHFQVSRCLFNEIDPENDRETVRSDYYRNVDSLAAVPKISAYSQITSRQMAKGKTVVNRDSKIDPRTAREYERSDEANGERSFVAVPLLRNGVWVASLWVTDDEPREWDKQDVALLETIAERTWGAVEKMRIGEALRESQERFAKAFSSGPLVFTLSSLKDGRLIEVNDTFVQVTGYSRQEAIGKTSLELGLWTKAGEREAEMNAVRSDGQVRNLEYLFRTRDGREVVGLLSAERIEIGGEPFALTVIQDITDRKRSQEALLKAERQAAEEYQALLGRIVPLAATLGRARDLVSIYRAVLEFIRTSMPCSGFFVSFFDAGTSMRLAAYVWGEGEEVDISQLPPMPLMPKGGGANSRAVFEKRTIITNNYWDDMKNRPHVVIHENGIDPMSSLIVPMMIKGNVLGTLEVQAHENDAFDQEHAVAMEMAANLAAVAIENVRLIETEAAAREAAETANRAKDDFLSVLSHELRTPLNAILGWVRMLRAGVLEKENSNRALEVIERNTRLQSNLIEDLLDVSRIISGKMRIEPELVDLVAVVKTVSEGIKPLADAKNIAYCFSCAVDSVFLTADAVRLQQVVSNLLQNSIKFTPAGGSIEIAVERREANAVLRVRDTGVGIEADLLPHIFDRFRQADASARRNFTGLGLGLTIVHNIVELHGGSIDVKSDGKDKGSTFILTLPLAEDFYEGGKSLERLTLGTGRSLAGKAILLVDDDPENLLPLKLFLEGEEAVVTPAANGSEALRHLAERDFHVMITDIGMPGMDGFDLVAKLRANGSGRNSAVKAIALTAYASVDDRQRALESGFVAHLAKPVNFEDLLSAIEKIADTGK